MLMADAGVDACVQSAMARFPTDPAIHAHARITLSSVGGGLLAPWVQVSINQLLPYSFISSVLVDCSLFFVFGSWFLVLGCLFVVCGFSSFQYQSCSAFTIGSATSVGLSVFWLFLAS
jgi:hypothetical protein